MLTQDLINHLRTFNQNDLFMVRMIFHDNQIDFDWDGERQTVKEVISGLETFNNTTIYIDIEDGFTYRPVIGVESRYWSKDTNYLDFISN